MLLINIMISILLFLCKYFIILQWVTMFSNDKQNVFSFLKFLKTRMHSSRMCTACSSSCLLWGVYLITCWDTHIPGVGLETPSGCRPGDPPPGVGLESPPPRCGSGDSPGQTPNLPPGCGPGDPPGQTPQPPPPPWVCAWRPPRSNLDRTLDTRF